MIDFARSSLCLFYPLRAVQDQFDVDSPAWHWINIKFSGAILGLADLRARQGTFNTPWNARSKFSCPLPDLFCQTESLNYLMDQRGHEIFQTSLRTGKKIAILWSGGIDSTSVLVSLLKAVPANEQKDRLLICLSPDSIIENFKFYKQFISNRIPIAHKFSINIDNDFLKKHILLSGEPGDAIFGPTVGKYSHLIEENKHKLIYRDNLDLLENCVNRYGNKNFVSTVRWLINKINANLEEFPQPGIETIADWFWWQYINFKWEGSVWKPIHSTFRKRFDLPIEYEQAKNYLDNVFFNTANFQAWSYANRNNFSPAGRQSHKHEIKKYIFDFDKNQGYFNNKTQTASIASDVINGSQYHSLNRPVVFDHDWIGYTLQHAGVKQQVIELLTAYQG